jgi:hypothetical protein
MKRRANLTIEAGLLLSVGAFLSYFFFFVRFPATRDFPWVNLPLFLPAMFLAGLGIWRAFRQPERYRGKVRGPLLGLLSLAIFGLFLFSTLVMPKQMPSAHDAPGVLVGEAAPDFTIPDVNGKLVTLSSLYSAGGKKQWVLLVFYRGYW